MKSTIIGTIVYMERLNNSVSGNPRYKVTVKDEDGCYFYAKTASGASCGYALDCYYGEKSIFLYHITKAANIIIDDIDLIA